MISLMTYNLGSNSLDRVHSAIHNIAREEPDILVLNELDWLKLEPDLMDWMSKRLSLPNYCIAESTQSANHVALFSRFPLDDVTIVPDMKNAGIVASAKSDVGVISIAGVHLASNTEDTRLAEILTVISLQERYPYKVILGDLNSISPENSVKCWSPSEIRTQDVRHDVVMCIRRAGYIDAAVITRNEEVSTVPLTRDNDIVYYDLRLDYIFLSDSFAGRNIDYGVIINAVTYASSDHYPIIARVQ